MSEISIRPGVPADESVVLGFFDAAVEWLVQRGSAGQWGTEPFSGNEKRIERARGWANGGTLHIAELGGEPVGAIALTDRCPAHVERVGEPEVYVDLLITSRAHAGLGIGGALLEHAREHTRRHGVSLLRVDCWAGGDGALVRYYQRQGFVPTSRFDVRGWIGQVFEQRIG